MSNLGVYSIFVGHSVLINCDKREEVFEILNTLLKFKTDNGVSLFDELAKIEAAFKSNGVAFVDFNAQVPLRIVNMLLKPYGLSVGW